MLTSKQYVRLRGSNCPVCESSNIGVTGVTYSQVGINTILQTMCCFVCETLWVEIYKLTRIIHVTERKQNATTTD